MIQIGKYNPIFFAPRKYRYGTGEYVQRFDLSDTVRFELLSGKGETAAVRLNNLSTGESQPLLPQTFSVSDETDAHVYSVQPGEGFFSVTVGDTSSVESEPFRICSCSECTSLMEYSNADNDADGGAFVNGDEKITFMFRFEGGIKPVDTEHRCENESFRDQRQRIHNLYSAAYEVLKLTVGDTSTGCPEWYAGFFNRVLCLSDVKINGESLARSEGSTPEKTQMQEGSSLVYFTINLEAEGTSSAGGGGNFNPGGGGGFSVYIITTDDLTAASDANLFSALRTLREIEGRSLSKQHEDTTNYLLNLLGGIISPFLTSPDFISGALGTGFTVQRNADGTTYAEVDRLFVRMKALFQILEILKTDVAGGEMVVNSGPRMKVTRVERTGDVPAYFSAGQPAYFAGGERAYFAGTYRLHFLADDGDTAVQNLFRVGDLARCQTFDIRAGVYENVSNRFWWRLVTAVGDDWIEVSDTVCAEGSDAPKEGDTVVQMGSDRDTDRQALIVLSAYGQGAPSLTMYQGIDSFSLSGKDVFSIGYDPVKKECFLNSYGRAYIGDRNGKYYMKYSSSEGLVIRPRKFLLESGDDLSDTLARIEQNAEKISLSVTDVRDGLKRTGIDIESEKVTVTADSFFVNSTAGTPLAVFTTDKDGRPLLKAEYIDVDNLYVKHLKGAEGSLVRGTIGGFQLENGHIGVSSDPSGANGGLSIFEDFMRVGDTRNGVFIGANVYPAYSSTIASGRFTVSEDNPYGTNMGIYVDVTGGQTNVGIRSNGLVWAPAFLQSAIRVDLGSSYSINFSEHNMFFLFTPSPVRVSLPSEADVRNMFSLSSLPYGFCLFLVFRMVENSQYITLTGVYNMNGDLTDIDMSEGDSVILVASNAVDGGFRYYMINDYR